MRGLSLIELVMFIAIVGISLAGVLAVYAQTVRASADPLVRQQATAVAEAVLDEVMAQPFGHCDRRDAASAGHLPPAATARCHSAVLPGLEAYRARVSVTRAGTAFGLAEGEVLRIDVVVTAGNENIALSAYRFRDMPNAPDAAHATHLPAG